MRWFLFSAGFLALFLLITPLPVLAASTTNAPTLSVTPSIIQIDLQQDPPTFQVYYKNSSSIPVSVALHAQDFNALENDWRLNFLDPQSAANYRYALSDWMTFDKNQFIIAPNTEEVVTVSINANHLTAGTHYGTIQAELLEQPNGQVPIHAILSSLVFVRTNTGNEHEEGHIEALQPVRDVLAMPYQFLIKFNNTGNVTVTPYGTLTITDMFGHKAAFGVVNDGSQLTLPESIRTYQTLVQKTQPFLFPGRYTATLDLTFGKTNVKQSQRVTFFSLGSIALRHIIFAIGCLVGGIWLIQKIRAHRKHT